MKIKLTILAFLVTFMSVGQKKKNGNMYIDHPAIKVIENLHEAMNSNDADALNNILSDNFRGVWGDQFNKDLEPQTKAGLIQTVQSIHENNRYFNVNKSANSYPDAVEYKDENFAGVTWVYSWEIWSMVGGTTGIDYTNPRHVQYVVNKDNQVAFARVYRNQAPYTETNKSQRVMENGKIFSHHPNINTVRKFAEALERNDKDNMMTDFHENVVVNGLFNDWGNDPLNLEDLKNGFENFHNNFEIKSMDTWNIRYFEVDSGPNFVQSWWRVDVKRKSDGKDIVFPVMFNHGFDNDGKIIRHFEAWNGQKVYE